MVKCIVEFERTEHILKFQCEENAVDGGYCKLHHPEYWSKHPDEIIEIVEEKIRISNSVNAPIVFIKCHFPTIKINQIFDNLISFQESTFHDKAYFSKSVFKKSAIFSGCKFLNHAEFDNCNFQHEGRFLDAEFSDITFKDSFFKEVVFTDAKIKRCYFTGSTIELGIFVRFKSFEHCYLGDITAKELRLNSSEFHGKAMFDNAIIDVLKLHDVKFMESTSFHNVTFLHPEKIIFDIDLSTVSFSQCDITKVHFGDPVRFGGLDKYTIINEINFRKVSIADRLGKVLTIYRNLRENFEYNLRYEEAGKFYFREMELKREYSGGKTELKTVDLAKFFTFKIKYQNTPISKGQQSFLQDLKIIKRRGWFGRNLTPIGLYFWISDYGESFTKPLVWSIPIIVFSMIASIINHDFMKLSVSDNLTFIGNAFYNNITAFLQIRIETQQDHIIRVLSAPLLGVLFIALRRKFERRFRH